MKTLLLTGIAPCTNYTAGLVLAQALKLLPPGSVACFCVRHPAHDVSLDPDLAWLPMVYATRPAETGLHRPRQPRLRELASFVVEEARRRSAIPKIVDQAADFARREGVDSIWAVLEGQTLVRVAAGLADRLGLPLHSHVWDPLSWWLRVHQVDRWHSRQALRDFDAVLRRSRYCAAASDAMAEEYTARYGVPCVPLIASHDAALAAVPPPRPHAEGEIVIGMAGQFYAMAEWRTLLDALRLAGWQVAGRRVRLLVLGREMPEAGVPAEHVEFLGWQSQAEAIRLLAGRADLLYCPYPSEPEMAEVARLSFPSKLVLYFAAGRPVLFHGPAEAAPAKYLTRTGAGQLVAPGSTAAVQDALHAMVAQPGRFAEFARAAQRAFRADFTLETMRAHLLEFLGRDASVPVGTPECPLSLA